VTFEVGDEIGLAHEVGDGLAEVAPCVDAEVAFRSGVSPFDMVFRVQDHDPVGQRAAGGAKAPECTQQPLLLVVAFLQVLVQAGKRLLPDSAAHRQRVTRRTLEP
jgi:hypothetical protein